MKMKTQTAAILITSLSAFAVIPAHAADESLQLQLRDAERQGRIYASYALNRHLSPFDFKVEVNGERAIIRGTVDEAVDKDLAEQIALSTDGIKKVENQIIVDNEFRPLPRSNTERGFNDAVTDATITASIKSKLLWNSSTRNLNTHVETRYGMVTLSGVIESDPSKELASYIAMNTDGVRAVDNRLHVNAEQTVAVDPNAARNGESAKEKVSDTWITTKIKSSLLYSKHIAASDIRVDTSNGVVALTGEVNSAGEKELAIDIAKAIRGVKRVDANELIIHSPARETANK